MEGYFGSIESVAMDMYSLENTYDTSTVDESHSATYAFDYENLYYYVDYFYNEEVERAEGHNNSGVEGALTVEDMYSLWDEVMGEWDYGTLTVLKDKSEGENDYDAYAVIPFQDAQYSFEYEAEWTYGDVTLEIEKEYELGVEWELENGETQQDSSYSAIVEYYLTYGDAHIFIMTIDESDLEGDWYQYEGDYMFWADGYEQYTSITEIYVDEGEYISDEYSFNYGVFAGYSEQGYEWLVTLVDDKITNNFLEYPTYDVTQLHDGEWSQYLLYVYVTDYEY